MTKNSPRRTIIFMIIVMILMAFNFSRLSGTECIRAIHVVTLVTMGAAFGVMVMNVLMMKRAK